MGFFPLWVISFKDFGNSSCQFYLIFCIFSLCIIVIYSAFPNLVLRDEEKESALCSPLHEKFLEMAAGLLLPNSV